MSLPGKLCIGILEEDNPLKSYFRFKPLLVEADGRYEPYEQDASYPEEGCIRIVPDKNESYHFKARMRRIGLFCVVDLRAHPEENDKIRPNKNYQEGGSEHNACIIYSDVVREPAPGMIFEILPESDAQAGRPAPRTAEVLLRGEALSPVRHQWTAPEGEEGRGRLAATEAVCPLDMAQVFKLPTFGGDLIEFAVLPPASVPRVCDMPEKPAEKRRAAEGEARADERPVPEKPAEDKRAPRREGRAEAKPAEPEPEEASDKPWLHHDSSMSPRRIDPRLSPAQRVLAAQTGLNPRRGRSLQELIDEKWQQSRLNQLGQPVAPITTGAPVASPVDSAVSAVREVWNQPQLRGELLASLGGIEEFGASLQECREAARQRDIEQHLEALEERRLSMLGEIDRLKAGGEEIRQRLSQEICEKASGDLSEALEKARAAQAEQARYEQLADQAREAAQDARKAVDALAGEELEQRLREFALNSHMLERIAQIRGEAEPVPQPPKLAAASIEALTERVLRRFAAAGFDIDREAALNLCVCAAISPVLLIGGPVGSGKTAAARLLADALGLRACGRYVEFAPGRAPLAGDARVEALGKLPGVPALLLLDDANLYGVRDPLRGLGAIDAQWRVVLTVQDSHSAHPVPANAWDKGFALRLKPRADAPWTPIAPKPCPDEAPVSLADAVSKLLPQPESAVPTAVVERMDALRRALAAAGAPISRRALTDSWNYCALMIAAQGGDAAPMRVLDLAVAQRILPGVLASAPIEALSRLPALLEGLPESRALLGQPLAIRI